MKKLILICLIFFLVSVFIPAQECGPSCPVCSGSADGLLLAKKSFLFNTIYIPNGEEEQGRINLRYGAFSWMDIGIGYAIKTKKLIWNARIQVLKEKDDSWIPDVILGTGSVQTGGSDQSLYLYLTKSSEFSETLSLSMTAGMATLLPDFNKVYGLVGVTLSIREKFSIFANYDGINFHEGISWIPLDWLTVSCLLVESRTPAISIGIKAALFK